MKKLYTLVIIVISSLGLFAEVPGTISWQGILQDDQGDLLNGQYTLTFSIHDSQSGGNKLWEESHTIVISEGLTNIILGMSTALNLDFENQYWLQIQVGNGTPLSRIKLTSVPYAMTAKNVVDKSITYNKLQDASGDPGTILMWDGTQWIESISGDDDSIIGNEILNVTDGTLTRNGGGTAGNPFTVDVSPLGIDTPELANNAVTSAKVGAGQISGGAGAKDHIANLSIDSWDIADDAVNQFVLAPAAVSGSAALGPDGEDNIIDASITGADIANGNVVRSIGEFARLTDHVFLVEGPNISIDDNTPGPGDIQISATFQTPEAPFVIINNVGDTVVIFKSDSVIIKEKSYHYKTEYYYEGTSVITEDGKTGVVTYPEGLISSTTGESGNSTVTEISPGRAIIYEQNGDGENLGGIDMGIDPESGSGFIDIYDQDGNPIYKIDSSGSYHYVPEYFYQGTIVQNEDGSQKVETYPDGVTVSETDSETGHTVTNSAWAEGNYVDEMGQNGEYLGGAYIGLDYWGSGYMMLYDDEGNPIFSVDKYGSHHFVKEYFEKGIEVKGDESDAPLIDVSAYSGLDETLTELFKIDQNSVLLGGETTQTTEIKGEDVILGADGSDINVKGITITIGNVNDPPTPTIELKGEDVILGADGSDVNIGGHLQVTPDNVINDLPFDVGDPTDPSTSHWRLEPNGPLTCGPVDGVDVFEVTPGPALQLNNGTSGDQIFQIDGTGCTFDVPGTLNQGATVPLLDDGVINIDGDGFSCYPPSVGTPSTTLNNDGFYSQRDLILQAPDMNNYPILLYECPWGSELFKVDLYAINSSLPCNLTGDVSLDGTVGIGDFCDINPGSKTFDISGTSSDGDFELSIGDGSENEFGAVIADLITQRSDRRLKNNLKIIENPIEKICNLNGYYYFRNGNDKKQEIGVIAQEVEKVLPELVGETDNGYKNVAYSRMVAVLIEAVKEQQKLIDKQEEEIENLKQDVAQINSLTEQNKLIKAQYIELQKAIEIINLKIEQQEGIKTVEINDGE